MSRVCEICGKSPQVGNSVSHAHNKSKKVFYPNLQSVKMIVDGKTVRKKICTKCLKARKKIKT